jgi:transcriptional regulator with XRE-family HTH domain
MSVETLPAPPRAPVFSTARLVAARQAARLTQREMGQAINRALRHYQGIEYGTVNPTAEQLGLLAFALGVAIDDLYAIPQEGDTAA